MINSSDRAFKERDKMLMRGDSDLFNAPIYEAIVNGDDFYDPVESITIKLVGGFSYEIKPDELETLIVRIRP